VNKHRLKPARNSVLEVVTALKASLLIIYLFI